MLKLLAQLFGREDSRDQRFSDDLIDKAIERVLDATDPRVRALSGYARQVRPAVVHAMEHIDSIDQALHEFMPMSPTDWSGTVLFEALFASGERIRETIIRDRNWQSYISSHPLPPPVITAMLVAEPSERQVIGNDLVNDEVVSDVAMTVASFDNHRLVCLGSSEASTRRRLKRRAFDYLQVLALGRITRRKQRRKDLMIHRRALQASLDMHSRKSAMTAILADQQMLRQKIEKVDAELATLGADDTVVQQHLQIISDTLGNAEKHLWLDNRTLFLDSMNTIRQPDHPKASEIALQCLKDSTERRFAVQLVRLSPDAFRS